ncbi:MAG: aminopeptidase [Cyclobacteriaceae bacterium]|nr:aminopeptidase [Cyclobacteriaceae bacterium]MCB9236409.1 aminopeptidase [Flammeovirgaceae bacterium]MCO5272272.1 aminopeptidase [Cyclobacteriaceae bacterium]
MNFPAMKNYPICFLVLIFLGCQPRGTQEQGSGPAASYLNWQAIADKLVERSQLQAGEQVLLVGHPGRFDPLIPLLKAGIEKAGASYLGTYSIDSVQPAAWQTDFTATLKRMDGEELPLFLSTVDLGIMLPGATPVDKVYAGMQEVLRQGKSRTIHFHWAGAYDMNGQLFEPDSAVDVFYENVLLKTNYPGLAARQQQFEEAMRDKWVQVTTPAGTDIKFRIGDRQVTKQDGDASLSHMAKAVTLIDREVELPSGAIRVAPIEESVEGVIAFPDSQWNNQMAEGVKVTIKAGKVTEVNAAKNLEAVNAEMNEGGEAARSFREFALGFNPLLAIPDNNPWIPYYGYGAGVVRLSLGDNTELGGKVTGGYVRWNFFSDATVKVGDDVWVENGKLVK